MEAVMERKFDVVHGDGELVDMLQDALDRAKAGELDAVGLVLCVGDEAWINMGKKEGASFAWARLTAGAMWLQQHLIANEL
jgi:hypothetical protein